MTPANVRRLLLERYGIRVEDHMAQYLLTRLQAQHPEAVAIIGGNARTGVSLRHHVRPAELISHTPQVR